MTIKCKNWSVPLLLASGKETFFPVILAFFPLEDCATQISKHQVFMKSFKKSSLIVTGFFSRFGFLGKVTEKHFLSICLPKSWDFLSIFKCFLYVSNGKSTGSFTLQKHKPVFVRKGALSLGKCHAKFYCIRALSKKLLF